tara:strand:+ start:2835 stop:3014 length:180 start_codon:yes stop_codon:yes gene_type:complete
MMVEYLDPENEDNYDEENEDLSGLDDTAIETWAEFWEEYGELPDWVQERIRKEQLNEDD